MLRRAQVRHLPNGGPLPASAGLATATPSANTYDAIRRNLRGIVYDSPAKTDDELRQAAALARKAGRTHTEANGSGAGS